MNLSPEILNEVMNYLSGESSLSDLRDWEVSMFLKRDSLSPNDTRFLLTFERHYGELALGLPEEYFKAFLKALAAPSVIAVSVSTETVAVLSVSSPMTGSSSDRWSGSTEGANTELTELIPA